MLNKISKKVFEKDEEVRDIINEILSFYENRVFYDIELKKYVTFNYANNSLSVIPVA